MKSPAEMIDLTGQVVIVTGASGGIGSGIAATVLRRRRQCGGPCPIGRDRSLDGPQAIVHADLTSQTGPAEVVEAAVAAFGRIDALVNNAGIQPKASLADLDDAAWAEMIDTNLTAVHRLTRAVAALMVEPGRRGSDRPHRLDRGEPTRPTPRPLRDGEGRGDHARQGGRARVRRGTASG